ncbi:MAG: oxygen-independent coproporphyrinogen III oxidase [Deltaproteobacteria bacterium]|nr:oxygen-independent coproporphyrinogen III oxidase [Deltaproteobacteria bacterium]
MGTPLRDIPFERIAELVAELDVRGPRYTSYPTVPVWKRGFPPEAFARAVAALPPEPIALYLHFPFCRRRCLYCGCNSFITNRPERIERYVAALERECVRLGELLPAGRRHARLHLGGGTPTHVPAGRLARLLDRVLALVPGAPGAERSVEVDPRITTGEHLSALAARGFTRLSAGVQDLDPAVQRAVRREYALSELLGFVARARAAGFESVNLDLIYGLPRQSEASWRATLEAILQAKPDRLACFGFAYLPAQFKHQRVLRAQELPSPAERIRMLLAAGEVLTSRGYEAIGLDHFALPADPLAAARRAGRLWRNFMGYDSVRGLELVGLGSSAISELEGLFVQNETQPERYAATIEAGTSPIVRGHALDADDRYRKALINHLMCNLELGEAALGGSHPIAPTVPLAELVEKLRPFERHGLVELVSGSCRVTPLGQLFLRNLAMPLDRYLSEQQGLAFSRTV